MVLLLDNVLILTLRKNPDNPALFAHYTAKGYKHSAIIY